MAVFRRCAKATPTPVWPSKNEVRSCHVVRPGSDGIGALAVATAAAMPRRASERLLLIWFCSPATDWPGAATLLERLVIVDGLRFETARWPLASLVTKLVGPDWAARL